AAIGADMHFAQQLDLDAEDRVVVLHPALLVGGHGIDERDDPVAADGDGDETADGPQFRKRRFPAFGDGADGGMRAVAVDDAAEQAVARRDAVPALLLPSHDGTLKITVQQSRHSLPSKAKSNGWRLIRRFVMMHPWIAISRICANPCRF